jgi:flagellar biosynthesis protein FliR
MAQMQSLKPARKVSVGAAVGALVTLVVWVIEAAGHTTVPAYVAVALSTLLTFIISYLVPPSDGDQIVS